MQTFETTHMRKIFLQRLLNRLARENAEYCEPFAKPVDAVAEGIPTYHTVIKRPMDLRTLRKNLRQEIYGTVDEFESDFHLMAENTILLNGRRHGVAQCGLHMQHAFRALTASLSRD